MPPKSTNNESSSNKSTSRASTDKTSTPEAATSKTSSSKTTQSDAATRATTPAPSGKISANMTMGNKPKGRLTLAEHMMMKFAKKWDGEEKTDETSEEESSDGEWSRKMTYYSKRKGKAKEDQAENGKL